MTLGLGATALAAGALETNEFVDVTEKVRALSEELGPENVLLVCDIDNTLLAMNGDLGSDQWFEWQDYLLEHEPDSPHLVADDFPGLLAAQGMLFDLGKMHPPEPEQPKLIEAVQQLGVPTLVITSRSEQFRAPTERELKACGYDFGSSALPLADTPCGVYAPYDLDKIEDSGLTREEAKLFKLKKPRPVSYRNGVFMTAGQHKGAMLLTMLARSDRSYKAVVFVDDHGRHVVRVFDALARRGIDITTFHYKREDTNVDRFKYGDKQGVAERWRLLDKTLREVFQYKSDALIGTP